MHALAPALNSGILYISLYSVVCGGNDQTDRKYFGVMVRYWDKISQEPVTQFLSMPVCNIATGQSLLYAIDEVLPPATFLGIT